MKPSVQALGQILYSPSQYVIPVFQRNYRWEEKEWSKLWESLEAIQAPDKRGNHFMGFLVFVAGLAQPGHHTQFHLIDGQQRLTTLSLLLIALRDVSRTASLRDLATEIHDYSLVHGNKRQLEHYRLLPKAADQERFLALVDSRTSPSGYGRMASAHAFFKERIALLGDDETKLRTLYDVVCQRLEFMCATLESENAYNIFKSLNSTGIPLGPSDLIRNFVFMHVRPEEHDEFDQDLWAPLERHFASTSAALDEERFSRFFRDFLMARGRYVAPKDTFASFEAAYEATDFEPRELAAELKRASAWYDVIRSEASDASPNVSRGLKALNALDSSTTYPLLVNLFERRAKGLIDDDELATCVEMLNGFILRRFVCGESSRGYGQIFVRACQASESATVDELRKYLQEKGWPDVLRFRAAFESLPLYSRGYARHILETLERAQGHREQADLALAQIEHVLPQTLSEAWQRDLGPGADAIHAEWLDRPGNLTLSAYNQTLWNHPFAQKRAHYADSNITITRALAAEDRWGVEQIRRRGQWLSELAARIWIGPDLPPDEDADDDRDSDLDTDERRERRRRFWGGLSEYLKDRGWNRRLPGRYPYSTTRLSSGIEHIGYETRVRFFRERVGIDVWFWRAESMPAWEALRAQPAQIEAMMGGSWEFHRIPGREKGRMSLERPAPGIANEATWPALYEWFHAKLEVLYRSISPLIEAKIRG
ncbi:hypothetical protein BURK1_00226 [Burkholderiales bacterium]|nr:hypothetical protein BURK1_00226 [Burkholderiales bacterium]